MTERPSKHHGITANTGSIRVLLDKLELEDIELSTRTLLADQIEAKFTEQKKEIRFWKLATVLATVLGGPIVSFLLSQFGQPVLCATADIFGFIDSLPLCQI